MQGAETRRIFPVVVLAQQRYAKSHRILANCRGPLAALDSRTAYLALATLVIPLAPVE